MVIMVIMVIIMVLIGKYWYKLVTMVTFFLPPFIMVQPFNHVGVSPRPFIMMSTPINQRFLSMLWKQSFHESSPTAEAAVASQHTSSCSSRITKLIMPQGRPSEYLHHGKPPAPPEGGEWSSEAARASNPPYAFLSGALIGGNINPYGSPADIYSNNHQLHCINPKRFRRFFHKAVKNILDINLNDEEETSASSSKLRSSKQRSSKQSSSNPSSGASTIPSNISTGTAPSKTFTMNYSDSDEEHPFSGSSPGPGIVTGADGVPFTPSRFEPFPLSEGPHSRVQLDHSIVPHTGGNTGSVIFTPPADMTEGNLRVKVSSVDSHVLLIMWPKGNTSDPKTVKKSFTDGNHVMSLKQLQYCCNMISRVGQDFSKYRIKWSSKYEFSTNNIISSVCPVRQLSQIILHSPLVAFVSPELCSFLLWDFSIYPLCKHLCRKFFVRIIGALELSCRHLLMFIICHVKFQ